MLNRAKLGARTRTLLAGALVVATGVIAQVPAHAAPPPPTVTLADGADGWINAAESSPGVVVIGTYDESASPAITAIEAKIVDSAICDPFAGTQTALVSFAPSGDGTFTSPPFDVVAFPEGAALCALARSVDAVADTSVLASSGLATLDRVAPTASISLGDGDGIVSATEATTGVPVSWEVTEAGPLVSITAFNDASLPTANCTYGSQPRGPIAGAITPVCFADLAEGAITVAVDGTDAAGNPASATDGSIMDALLPAPAVAIAPSLITSLNQTAVTVAVTAGHPDETGTVVIDDDANPGTPALSAPISLATGSANAVFDVTSLDDGTLTATVTVTDLAGNVGTDSATATKEATAPGAPVIVTPIQFQVLPQSFPVSGTAEPGSVVRVYDVTTEPAGVDTRIATTTTNAQGNWSTVVRFGKSGVIQLQAAATDTVGNVSALSSIRTIDVDHAAPIVTLESPTDNSIYLPGDTVTIEGTAQDDGKGVLAVEVHLFTMGQQISTTQIKTFTCLLGCPLVNSKVRWEFKPNVGIGYYTAKIWGIDVAGNRSPQPVEVNFIKTL